MEKTIGQLMGIVSHTLSVTNDRGDKVTITINVDFRTSSDTDCRTWNVSNRVIAGQRPWRSLTKAELEKLNGSTFIAQNIGQKVKSYGETKQAAVAAFDTMSAEQQQAHIAELEEKAKEIPEDVEGGTDEKNPSR